MCARQRFIIFREQAMHTSTNLQEVRQFVRANRSFFESPVKDQEAFKQYFAFQSQIDTMADYSDRLTCLLANTKGRDGEPLLIAWMNDDFDQVLENKKVRKFIIENKNHPAIGLWRKKLDEQEEEILQAQTIQLRDNIHNLRDILIEAEIMLNTCQGKLRDSKSSKQCNNNYIAATRSIIKSQIARCNALLLNMPCSKGSRDDTVQLH